MLFLIADDMRAEIGVYNDPVTRAAFYPKIHTPNLDALAKTLPVFMTLGPIGDTRGVILQHCRNTSRSKDTTPFLLGKLSMMVARQDGMTPFRGVAPSDRIKATG